MADKIQTVDIHLQLIGNTITAVAQTFEAEIKSPNSRLNIGSDGPIFADEGMTHKNGSEHRDPKCVRPFTCEAQFIRKGRPRLLCGNKPPVTMNDSLKLCDDVMPVRPCHGSVKQAKPSKLKIGSADVVCGP